MRLIDADALIEKFESFKEGQGLVDVVFLDGAQAVVETMPTADNWISVDEPPKEKDDYFIHYSKVVQIYTLGKIKTGVYEFDTGQWYDEAINGQITKPEYWQPLPEPPKENSKVYGGIKNEDD